MIDELPHEPFERSVKGPYGAFLARHNRRHSEESAIAIRRRNQPGWSRFVEAVAIAGER